MDTLTSMRVFRAVAELKSFAAAAGRLDISSAMASKHVMHLEERLATRLLNRTTRRVSLTEPGQLYLDEVARLIDGLAEIEATLADIATVPQGKIRLSAPPWLANPAFAAMLAEFHQLHPQVRLDIDLTGRPINLIEEGFDLALKAAPPDALEPGFIARKLAEIEFQLVASPAHLDRTGRPTRIAELEGRPFLLYSGMRSDGALPLDGDSGTETVRFEVVMESASEALLRQLAIQGLGLTFAPKWAVSDDLSAGRLELVLPGTLHTAGQLYAVYPSRQHLPSKVRTLLDFFIGDSRLSGPSARRHNYVADENTVSTELGLMVCH